MEDEIIVLNFDISSLQIAYDKINESIENLAEVDGLDNEYNQLKEILGKIDNEITNKRVKLSRLKEKENRNE